MKNQKFKLSLFISVVVHIVLTLMTWFAPRLFTPLQRETVEVTFESPKVLQPLPAVKMPEDLRQVVDQDEKALNDEKSEAAKFLSAHNQVVKKQTVAEKLGDFKNRNSKDQSPGDGGTPKIDINKLKPQLDFAKIVEKKREQEKQLEKTLDEDAIRYAQNKKQAPPKEAPAQKVGTNGADTSQTSDYLKDVDKGMETLLSTREFVYYSFYARIRRQLNQHWGGKVREKISKILKEGRSIASTDDKVTKLLITLNKKGQLVKVQLLGDSGVRDLDDAAIEAFQEAAPFPNPPSGIIESDGTIKIRWDFILEA
jgi:TonB family protein